MAGQFDLNFTSIDFSNPEPIDDLTLWTPSYPDMAAVRYTNRGFMERIERSLSTEVVGMPAMVVAKIASFVPWRSKLSLIQGVPEWADYLRDTEAWAELQFEDMPSHSLSKIRAEFLHCLTLYGRYMLDLHIIFKQEVDSFVKEIFDKLQRYASNLNILRLSSVYLCVDSVVEAFIKTLQRCERLKAVHLHWPHTYLHSQNNVVLAMYNSGLVHLLHTLDLSDTSFEGDIAHLSILKHFRNLRKLRVKRDRLSGTELVSLAQASLQSVSLFQDEESPSLDKDLDCSLLYGDQHWSKVIECKPSFRVNVIIKNIYVLRSAFPAQAPIRSLVFVDISSTLTKGLLDHMIQSYSKTLEVFVYSWTCDIDLLVGSNLRLDDRRVPASLPNFVRDCPRLHTLVYGYEISSLYILLTANTRRLDQFVVSLDALSFEDVSSVGVEEDSVEEGGVYWQDSQMDWLQDSCKDLESLELTVSNLFGCKWRVADAMCMAYAVEHYSSL